MILPVHAPKKRGSAMKMLLSFFLCILSFAACDYPHPDMSSWDIAQKTKDSLSYLMEHHFTLGANFEVRADSLPLEQLPIKDKFLSVYKGEQIVVAEFMTQSTDSVDSLWVKVARDQNTQGWVRKTDLLKQIVPRDSISQFIYLFSHTHASYFALIFVFFVMLYLYQSFRKKKLQLVYFNDIDSIFPMLLCVLIAFSATLYGSMQSFSPDTWEYYYFNPTFNPFQLPLVLALFVGSTWAIMIVAIAVLDDLYKQLALFSAFAYLLGLMSCCIFCYLFFIFTTSFYVGYLFLALFIYLFIQRVNKTAIYQYRCGKCNAKLIQKGECTHCGAVNE